MGKIVVESKKKGTVLEFTPEQWENLKRSGHDRAFKVLTAEGLLPEKQVIPEPLHPVEKFEETHLDIEYNVNADQWRKLLDEAGVKYNHRITDPLKLKALWDKVKRNDDLAE